MGNNQIGKVQQRFDTKSNVNAELDAAIALHQSISIHPLRKEGNVLPEQIVGGCNEDGAEQEEGGEAELV